MAAAPSPRKHYLGINPVCCAEGLYTEMDFRNEALNALRMQQLLQASEFVDAGTIVIPKPFMHLTTRSAFGPPSSRHCPRCQDAHMRVAFGGLCLHATWVPA